MVSQLYVPLVLGCAELSDTMLAVSLISSWVVNRWTFSSLIHETHDAFLFLLIVKPGRWLVTRDWLHNYGNPQNQGVSTPIGLSRTKWTRMSGSHNFTFCFSLRCVFHGSAPSACLYTWHGLGGASSYLVITFSPQYYEHLTHPCVYLSTWLQACFASLPTSFWIVRNWHGSIAENIQTISRM